jgi:hypothetical protein
VYLFDWKSSAAQFFSLGLHVPSWQRARYPNLPAAGRFEYETFDPMRWVASYPNAAFHNQTPTDGLWAARKIMAIDDAEIRAIVATGQYTDPAAEEWVARCLIERRKKIVNAFITGMGALDGFEVRDGRLEFSNTGAGAVAIQWSNFDNYSGLRRLLPDERSSRLPGVSDAAEYVVAELTGSTAGSISVYVSMKPNPRIAGIERHFDATQRPALERQPDKITSEE